jgi:hypothetical protein
MSPVSSPISSIVSSDSNSIPFHNHICRITMNTLRLQLANGPALMHGFYKPKSGERFFDDIDISSPVAGGLNHVLALFF